MVLVLDTEDRGLLAFPSAEAAIAYCEGIDVAAGTCSFFADDGSPLEARFTTPNQSSTLLMRSGTYQLEPSRTGSRSHLSSHLREIAYVEGCGFFTVADVERHLTAKAQGGSR